MQQLIHTSPFEKFCHLDERGKEFWYAHEFGKLLGYKSWYSFQNTLINAKFACEHSKQYVLDHFYLEVGTQITDNGSLHLTEAYRLSRYGCYLTILNANPRKPVVALGQAYFASQTRRQELVDLIMPSPRPDYQKQAVLRIMLDFYGLDLQKAAQETRVVEPEDFAIFFNHGYVGLIG